MIRKAGGEQIPGDGDQLHRVDAENVEGIAANGLQALGKGAVEPVQPQEQPDEQVAGRGVQQDAQRAEGPFAHGDAVGAAGEQGTHGGQRSAAQQQVQGAAGQGLVQPAVLFGQIADVQVRHDDRALGQAEGQLPDQAGAPAQQHTAQYRPVCVGFREDIQDAVQQDPAHQQGQ